MATERVNVLPAAYTATELLGRLHRASGVADITSERLVYYPYFRFAVKAKLPALFGAKDVALEVLVDAINGTGFTAETLVPVTMPVDRDAILEYRHVEDTALRIAQRTATNALTKRARTVAGFDMQLDARGIVYRPFLILDAAGTAMLADTVTGALHALEMRAA